MVLPLFWREDFCGDQSSLFPNTPLLGIGLCQPHQMLLSSGALPDNPFGFRFWRRSPLLC